MKFTRFLDPLSLENYFWMFLENMVKYTLDKMSRQSLLQQHSAWSFIFF